MRAPCAGMGENPIVPGRFMTALGNSGIRVIATAQGCDERNISAVVAKADATRALRSVHSAFLSHQARRRLSRVPARRERMARGLCAGNPRRRRGDRLRRLVTA